MLRARARMVVNTAFRQSRERRGWAILLAILGVAFLVVSYSVDLKIFNISSTQTADVEPVTAGVATFIAGFTAVTSVTFALSSLYFARDLDILMSAPMRPRVVLLSRLVTQLSFGTFVGLMLAGPALLAYAGARHQALAAVAVGVTFVALAFLPMALAVALVIFGIRLLPARYVRDAGGALVALIVFVVAAINLFARGPSAFQSKTPTLPIQSVGAGPAGASWSPMGWVARAATAAFNGDYATWAVWTLPLIGLGLVIPFVTVRVAESAYLRGFQNNATATARTRAGRRRRAKAGASPRRLPTWALVAVKDLREVRRDPSQMGQTLLPMVLFAFYLGRPSGPTLTANGLPPWYLVALNACVASLLFANNIALRGIGMEGQRMWMLRAAPQNMAQIMIAKYVAGFIIASIPACALLWIGQFHNGQSAAATIEPTVWVLVIIGGIVAIATCLGALRPRLDWTDPRRAVSMSVTLLFLGVGAIYVVCCLIVLGIPYAFAHSSTPSIVAADASFVVMTLIVACGAMVIGARRLNRLEV